tara:strand:+ start:255 stop:1343 length:1089 start_codon:yes stop_codon:yes gene_type:complete
MKRKLNNLLVAASGTGGHIFPALTIANDLDKDWNITWLGVKDRCEINLVPKKYKLLTLNIDSPRGKNLFLLIKYFQVLLATFQVLKIIHTRKIKLIFTTGGYISAPSIVAAKLLNIPVIIHESNLVPGLVTKSCGRFCDFVLTGFEQTNSYLKGCNSIYTGTPLRNQFYIKNKIPKWVPKGDGPLIIIMGGSQGAQFINDIIFKLLDFLTDNNFRIVHIMGSNLYNKFKNKNYIPIDFTNEIAALMQNCDLVISRSGSGSINEIIKTKTPSILIPYPYSKDNHQEKNALILSSKGCSIIINQNQDLEINLKKNLQRIFKLKKRNKNNQFQILDIMNKNISQLKLKDPRYEIKTIINSYRNDF